MNPNPKWTTRLVDAPEEDLLSKPEVLRLFGLSDDTLNRLIADGEFPEGLKVGKRMVVWEWRAIAYYRLRMELGKRLRPQEPADDPDSTADEG